MGYIAKRINEHSVGMWAASKVQALVSMVILLKLFDAPGWIYLASAICITFVIWLTGFIMVKTGFWARVSKESFRGSLYKEERNG